LGRLFLSLTADRRSSLDWRLEPAAKFDLDAAWHNGLLPVFTEHARETHFAPGVLRNQAQKWNQVCG